MSPLAAVQPVFYLRFWRCVGLRGSCQAHCHHCHLNTPLHPNGLQKRREERRLQALRALQRQGVEQAGGQPDDVLVPSPIPKGAVAKAVGLLMAEAELRGRSLPPAAGNWAQQQLQVLGAHGLRVDALAAAAEEEGDGEGENGAGQRHRHRQHRGRRLNQEEWLVALVLRQHGWAKHTQLPL